MIIRFREGNCAYRSPSVSFSLTGFEYMAPSRLCKTPACSPHIVLHQTNRLGYLLRSFGSLRIRKHSRGESEEARIHCAQHRAQKQWCAQRTLRIWLAGGASCTTRASRYRLETEEKHNRRPDTCPCVSTLSLPSTFVAPFTCARDIWRRGGRPRPRKHELTPRRQQPERARRLE